MKKEAIKQTFQTRLHLNSEQEALFTKMATLFCGLERKIATMNMRGLFDGQKVKQPQGAIRAKLMAEYKIKSDVLNMINVNASAKISSAIEGLKREIDTVQTQITHTQKIISWVDGSVKPRNKYDKIGLQRILKAGHKNALFQKQRLLRNQTQRLALLKNRLENNRPRLRFGSGKLWYAQNNLAKNGFGSHQEWKLAWQQARHNAFILSGAKGKKCGNARVRYIQQQDGSLLVKALMSDDLWVEFSCDLKQKGALDTMIANALLGLPVAWRFVRDDIGWRAFITTDAIGATTTGLRQNGMLGLDFNCDHISGHLLDKDGNPIKKPLRFNLVATSNDKGRNLFDARMTAFKIASIAKRQGVAVGIEDLDFSTKKAQLQAVSTKQARMLSGLMTGAFKEALRSACYRLGVELITKKANYTSVIGGVVWSKRKGLSVHHSASIAIGRRCLSTKTKRMSERLPKGKMIYRRLDGSKTARVLPADCTRHPWSSWKLFVRTFRADITTRKSAVPCAKARPTKRLSDVANRLTAVSQVHTASDIGRGASQSASGEKSLYGSK